LKTGSKAGAVASRQQLAEIIESLCPRVSYPCPFRDQLYAAIEAGARRRLLPVNMLVVERLMQLYEYDISGIFKTDLGDDGVFPVMDLDEIWQPPYLVFLVRVDRQLAGLAFVTRHPAYVGEGETWLMNELFILLKYRRRGVAEHVARTLFDRFPGRWEVAEHTNNIPAQVFWRRVLPRYVGEVWREVVVNTDRWIGPVQTFVSRNVEGSPEP